MLTYLMDRVTFWLEQHSRIEEFNQLYNMMPPYPHFTRFNLPDDLVKQWSGIEMNSLGRMIVPVLAETLFIR